MPQIKSAGSNLISSEPSVRQALKVVKPDAESIAKGEVLDSIVTDKQDKGELAVFTNEVTKRVGGYNTDSEVFSTVVATAGEEVFGETFNAKYAGKVGQTFQKDLKDLTGNKVIKVDGIKDKLKSVYTGYTWALGGENDEESEE